VAGWCERAGLVVEVEQVAPGRPNVIATARGSGGGRSLMLNAHLDTVGVAGMAEPFSGRLEGGRLYGRGAYDMKASLAASLLAAARAAELPLRGDVIVTAVADEELESIGTAAIVATRRADAAIVTEPTDRMDIQLPFGQWISYWDESTVVSGTLAGFPVPRGGEPVFIRLGALIPMDVERSETGHGTLQSRGSLTMLVYPSGTSSFRYRADARTPWITFSSTLKDTELTLAADPGLPEQPVLYRVGRWAEAPESVAVEGARVTLNQGGNLPRLASEAAVDGSRESAWFYDASARRLVVKVVP